MDNGGPAGVGGFGGGPGGGTDTAFPLYDDTAPTEGVAVPLGVMLVAWGTAGERLYFLHPFVPVAAPHVAEATTPTMPTPPVVKRIDDNQTPATKKPLFSAIQTQSTAGSSMHTETSVPTQFGLRSNILANILAVKRSYYDKPFEIKLDSVLYVGFPKKVTKTNPQGDSHAEVFSIVFVLHGNADCHLVEAFQKLSKKLALAIDSMQSRNNYLDLQEQEMRCVWEEFESSTEAERPPDPWSKVRRKSALAELLAQVYEDIKKCGCVQVSVDDFIEVGECIPSLALNYAHLTPRTRADLESIVSLIRPYHGILVLEDVWPMPDGNPSVSRFLAHCRPDLSIMDISKESDIPLLEVFTIVRHLIMWVRAIVIYPVCETNVYASATAPKPIVKHMERFARQFGEGFQLANALAQFSPPQRLDAFINARLSSAQQKTRFRVVVCLLRHQLLMQLHQFCYILPPFSGAELPEPAKPCPTEFKTAIDEALRAQQPVEVREIIADICAEMLEKDGYDTVHKRLLLFLRMAPFMQGQNHVEDIKYRLNVERSVIDDVIQRFSLILSSFYRPDFISESKWPDAMPC